MRRIGFKKTGCLITADGPNDHFIQPEDFPNYAPPKVAYFDVLPEKLKSNSREYNQPEEAPLHFLAEK